MTPPTLARAAVVAVPTILLIVGGLYSIACFVTSVLGLPTPLGFPAALRAAGAVLMVVGLAFAGWVFRYRAPATMMVSTYITFMKLFGRAPIAEASGRAEPLVVVGPQRYVRNPLYFGVIAIAFGWALVNASTYLLVAGVLLLLWFQFLIPFEERELRVLFGEQYTRYADDVPMLAPFTKRRKRHGGVMIL